MENEWRMVKLREVCSQIRGVSYTPSDLATELTTQCVTLLRANNIQDRMIFDGVQYVNRSKVSEKQYIKKGDILICASSGSKNLVGKAVQANENYDACFGAFCKVVRPKNIDIRYLGNYFKSDSYRAEISRKSRGANINNIKNEDIDGLVIPLPSLEWQREIAEVLDKANELVALRKRQLTDLDTLAESVFYDMFGDPGTNPKGWEKKELGKLGNLKNGLNYSKNSTSHSVKILGISDFKNNTVLRQTDSFQEIYTDEPINAEYLVNNNDIVFVRSNGSKELVGRCVIVNFKEDEIVTFSGFCIRFRKTDGDILSSYLIKVLSNKEFRKQLFNKGRGCNINNINQQMLSALMIIIPPLDLQNQFATIIEKIEEQKAKVKVALKESEDLFQRLMQDMFNPEYHKS